MNDQGPLATLDDVDWASLDHAYDHAGDVPGMLRDLCSPDPQVRDHARGNLHASLDHQGVQRFEATWRAIPFLIGLIGDPATPERGRLARLLAEFAVGDTCWFLHDGVHPEQQTQVDDAARAQHVSVIETTDFSTRGFPRLADGVLDLSERSGLRLIYDAVVAGVPTYLAAVEGGDAALRAAVPFLCGFLTPEPAAAASAPVLERLLDDPEPAVRASAALGLSHATRFVPALRARAFATLSARWSRELAPLERRCLALALIRFEDPDHTEAVRDHLIETLAAGVPAVQPDGFPWFRIDSPPFVFCTTYLGTAGAHRDRLREPACAALARIEEPHDAADLAVWIARLWVPAADDGGAWSRDDVAPPLHDTLAALAGAAPAWVFTDLGRELGERGLPDERDALAAWLA